ncbi:bifunctional endo-1,4-beta-xylanase XylA-like isoform X1 [Anopheles bellator]|uniref:bifunctional endo-1,4-beta-xylanase XylA-like isoform X1 n=1 Tax=Anopheles bellator TaxID=139047 RepID=UPI0026495384|nr:bifunctional endo-1,4-beta-xylanase XylA-like isoform X1 [Anopheles bellator]
MFKFVLIGALFVAAVFAAPADNKPGQHGQRGDGLDQAETAWNNPAGGWNSQNTWNRDPASWNHPNAAWNHPGAWNANSWNRGYNNRNDMIAAKPGYDPANRWQADPWNRWGGAGAGAGWNNYAAGRSGAAGAPGAAGWQGGVANRWNAW